MPPLPSSSSPLQQLKKSSASPDVAAASGSVSNSTAIAATLRASSGMTSPLPKGHQPGSPSPALVNSPLSGSSPPLSKRSSPARLTPIEGVLSPAEIRAKIELVEEEAMARERERCERQRRQRMRDLRKLQRDQEHHFSHFHRMSRLPVLDPTWRK